MTGQTSPTTVLNPAIHGNAKDDSPLAPLPDHYLVKDGELGGCLHAHFRRQAQRTPNRIAIQSPTNFVTYAQLDHATDQLAAMLLERGVTKDHCVGIFMERRNEYALSYIGIHKAGGAYMPLDPAYPEGLLHDVLVDSAPTVVVCTEEFSKRLPADQARIILSDRWDECLEELTPDRRRAVLQVDDSDLDQLAYIVYSSGTTGKPKGIACPHRGAVFSYQYRFRQTPYLEDLSPDAIPEVEGCNVFFVWEMLRPLLRGQTLVVIPDNVIYDPIQLAKFCQDMKITRMLFTPSLLEAVLDAHTNDTAKQFAICDRLACLKTIFLCGEVVTVALQERCKKCLPQARIWNLYSVSECHDVTCIELTTGVYTSRKYCPVGKLFEGVEAHVMEALDDGTLVTKAMGEVGELYVAGPTLARGYLKLPEMNALRFPTVHGTRLYKTGDNAKVLPNRELEILGRCDSMVKVRGYSVELRAIEAALLALTDLVVSCCVVVQGAEGEDKFVIAYVVLAEGATCRAVRLALKAKLPHYMVPAFLVDMEEFPTHTVSGKLDKKALPKVDLSTGKVVGRDNVISSGEGDCTVPRNPTEAQLHTIWCESMNLHQIDVVFDSFFDMGGHSLLAARLVQRIQAEMKVDVGVVELFANATIEALAGLILQKQNKSAGMPEIKQRTIDLEQEVKSHDIPEAVNDIAMRAFWRSTHFRQVMARSVMVTGATGFVGSFVCHELLRDPQVDVVYCLVRATSNAEASSRLQESLQQRKLWDDKFASKLYVFAADTSLHHMGLDEDEYEMLGTGVDMVVHCAALVNLVYPYEGLRSANVQGTRNVIEFALHGRVKKLAYISTDAVFPDGKKDCREDEDMRKYAKALSSANGYSQSKWVAEMLVTQARERGLPTVVFRPGNMGGVGGVWNPSDFNLLVLQGSIAIGAAPVVDGWIMEMTPVDFAAKAMVKLMSDNSNLGQTFHVTNFGNCLPANEYFDGLRGAGVALESVSLDEWNKRILATDSVTLRKLRGAILGGATVSVAALSELAIFNNDKFSAKCEAMAMPIPKITLGVMRGYLNDWQKVALVTPILPAAPKSMKGITGKPLAGKVAVITGASSGIGAGIAQALSLAGAKVGIGGRRLDRLKELASELMSAEGVDKVHPCKVDVTNRQDMETFCKECEAELGPIDIFVSNAGVMFYGRLSAMHEDQWHKELDVNCRGLLHATACVLPGMLARGSGHIVVTTSDAGRKVFRGLTNYSATKFFAEAFCQGMRLENCDKGLKVTTIQPGDCKTELSKCTTDEEARAEFAQPSKDREYWLDVEDVAAAVLYAVTAPSHVAINEVLIEPRGAPA